MARVIIIADIIKTSVKLIKQIFRTSKKSKESEIMHQNSIFIKKNK